MNKKNKDTWIGPLQLACITFSLIWGFYNSINSYYYLGQTRSVFIWLFILIVYFLPSSLMIAELGTHFKYCEGGVSDWVKNTSGKKMAYLCGWIIWSNNLIYLSQKPIQIIIAVNWILFQTDDVSRIDPIIVQLIGIMIFLFCVFIVSKGIHVIKVVAVFSGSAVFILSMLFIILGLLGPALTDVNDVAIHSINWSPEYFFPTSLDWIMNISIVIFSLTGMDTSAPYILRMKNPEKDFPKGILIVFGMLVVCCLFSLIALSIMFGQSGEMVGEDFLANGQYYAFQKLGQYFGLGNLLLTVSSLFFLIACFATLILYIDLPIRIFVRSGDETIFPKFTLRKNKNGVYTFWLWVVSIAVVILQIIPCLGIENTDKLYNWLVEINSISQPMYTVFIFIAYMKMKLNESFTSISHKKFVFIKNKYLACGVSIFCFIFTIIGLGTNIYSDDPFILSMNILLPLVLLLMSAIIPAITKIYNIKKLKI